MSAAGVSFSEPGDRVLGLTDFLAGASELALIVLPLAFGAARVRAVLLAGWDGAPARLAEVVIGFAGLIWASEIVGTFGAFELWPLIATSLALGFGGSYLAGRIGAARGVVPSAIPPAPDFARIGGLAAALAVAAVAAAWASPTLGAMAAGMDRADTLWYHMPLSARFVQTGELGQLFFFDPVFLASFYPANSEVLHAVPILAFERDLVSPLLNGGFLAVALLAAWCIGRPYGLGPQALVGSVAVLGANMLVDFQPGEALNDIPGVAFVLAAVAMLVNGHAAAREGPRRVPAGAIAVAGLAAGLAAGIKLSFLAPVAAIFVAAVVAARSGTRARTGTILGLAMLAAGGYWYARNLVQVGNPIPYVSSLGPIDLPSPARDFQLRPGFSVAHYLFDGEIWKDWFLPGLRDSFGLLWPLTLAMLGAGGAWMAARAREPIVRALGAAAVFTTLAYVVTPLTAAGEEGRPIAFEWNVRYLAPGAAIALALLPTSERLRRSPRARLATLGVLGVLAAVTIASLPWAGGHAKGSAAAAVLVLACAAGLAFARRRLDRDPAPGLTVRGIVAGALLAAVLAAGYAEQRHYLERRYDGIGGQQNLDEAVRWARDLRGARIAVAGIRGVFTQYPFYGTALENHVQWLGRETEHKGYERIPDCRTWRTELNSGRYTHVVTTFDPFIAAYLPPGTKITKEGLWTARDQAAKVLIKDGPVRVFELRGELDPATCGNLPSLTAEEQRRVPNLTGTDS